MRPLNQNLAVVFAVVLGLFAQAASATIHFVDQNATAGADDGSSFPDGFLNIQDALAVAGDGDEIRIAKGVYKPHTSNINVAFELVVAVQMIGGYPSGGASTPDPETYVTILSGDLAGDDGVECAQCYETCSNKDDNSEHIVFVSVPDGLSTEISGLTIRGGYVVGVGAGLYNVSAGNLLVSQCKFTCNYARDGGGAVYSEVAGDSIFEYCEFTDNTGAHFGGAMFNYSSVVTVRDSLFAGNSLKKNGGQPSGDGGGPGIALQRSAARGWPVRGRG